MTISKSHKIGLSVMVVCAGAAAIHQPLASRDEVNAREAETTRALARPEPVSRSRATKPQPAARGTSGHSVHAVYEAQQRALAHLRQLGISWDPDKLRKVPRSAGATLRIERPRELARDFGVGDLDYVERRPNGREVYRTPDGEVTVKSNLDEDYWKLIRRSVGGGSGAALDEAEVKVRAEELARTLEVPADQRGGVLDSSIAGATSDGAETVLGHHVEIKREVNGLPVDGSRVLAIYDGQPVPVAAEARWPPFELADMKDLKSIDEALAEISGMLAESFVGGEKDFELKHKLSYRQNESGAYEPILTVWVFDNVAGGAPSMVEYSLVSGIKSDPLLPSFTGNDS